jgi:hypothetical protein
VDVDLVVESFRALIATVHTMFATIRPTMPAKYATTLEVLTFNPII